MAQLNSGYLSQPKTQALIGKWNDRIRITEGLITKNTHKPMSLDKKAALAVTLNNTQRLLESTQASNIG